MAPPLKARENNFLSDIGVAGRKTGITVKDTGQRDASGMELPDAFFSPEVSPEKEFESLNDGPSSSPAKMMTDNQTISAEESMEIVTSEPAPARLTNRASLPPRALSPIKTNLKSPARRASSVGYSSPEKRSSPLQPPPQRHPSNRRLDFSSFSQPSSTVESSPVLPGPMPPAAPLSSSSQGARVNGVPSSSDAAERERAQPLEARNKGKGKGKAKAQLDQVVEEEPPTPVAEPTPPAKKRQKRGLLVQKKPTAAGKRKAFSMDIDSSGKSTDETGALEEEEEAETTSQDEGLSQILNDSGVIEEDIVMVDNAEEEQKDEDEDSLPNVIPGRSRGKQSKAKPGPVKQKAAAAKKAKEAPPEKQSEKENTQTAKTKPDNTEKLARRKATKGKTNEVPEPAPAAKPKPALKGRAKKIAVQETPEETEAEEVEEARREPTPPPPKAKVKAATKGKGKGLAVVEEPERDSTPPPPPPPLKVKAAAKGKGKGRAKAIKEVEEIPESKQEQENVEADLEEQEEQEDVQPAKKRSRITKEKAAPKPKSPAKAKGKALAVPLKEKTNKAAKKTAQKAIESSPEPQSFAPSSPPAPPVASKSRTKAKAKATKAPIAAAEASGPPPSSQSVLDKAIKKSGQRIIKAPPPPPRAPSEDMDGVRRSTRPRFEPLAFWKNEKIVYGLGARRKSGRSDDIRLPEVVEVVRVESDSEAEREKKQRRKRSYAAASAKIGSKRKRVEREEDDDELEEEDWESRTVEGEIGVVRGYVKSYPPGDNPGEEELEEVELAFSRNRIVTVEVANGDFTFVKTCTEEFFGTGMIEVPPGGIKRTKNSGKMHLVFYMLSGKVEVKVGENSFRVRKGAQFMVPRGNLYSIQNPYDVQARMFFAQGCEVFVSEEDE